MWAIRVYKPTYNWGAPSCTAFQLLSCIFPILSLLTSILGLDMPLCHDRHSIPEDFCRFPKFLAFLSLQSALDPYADLRMPMMLSCSPPWTGGERWKRCVNNTCASRGTSVLTYRHIGLQAAKKVVQPTLNGDMKGIEWWWAWSLSTAPHVNQLVDQTIDKYFTLLLYFQWREIPAME